MEPIFHIAERAVFEAARAGGQYQAGSLESEGFIHCSTRSQVLQTANRYYRGRSDLVLLRIDAAPLGAALRYEPAAVPAGSATSLPARAELFPHVYGAIPLSAVTHAVELAPDAGGEHAWPAELADSCD